MIEGKVVRINGPIIKATGLGGSGLYDVVEIGEKRLIGEIIRLEGDTATIQIYEDNTGMRVGEKRLLPGAAAVRAPRARASWAQIYDGIQRPLTEIKRISGGFINPGRQDRPAATGEEVAFRSLVQRPASRRCPGPSSARSGNRPRSCTAWSCRPSSKPSRIEWVAPEGDYTISEPVLRACRAAGR